MRPASQVVLALAAAVAACSDSANEPSAPAFARVIAGPESACAIDGLGRAFCWGENTSGQLGNGTTDRAFRPVPVSGDVRFSSVAIGSTRSCGIGAGGRALCWGAREYGTLGSGPLTGLELHPQAVRSSLEFHAIDVGGGSTCGVAADGDAYCWGFYSRTASQPPSGDLPAGVVPCYPNLSRAGLCAIEPLRVDTELRYSRLVSSGSHTCALTVDQAVYCRGENYYGQLGRGADQPADPRPGPVAGEHRFLEIGLGPRGQLSCALEASGVAYCWGELFGHDGIRYFSAPEPTPVEGGLTFRSLTVGERHGCGLASAGAAYCWGENVAGAIGDGTTEPALGENVLVATPVAGGHRFRSLSAGTDFTCGVTTNGAVLCWGANGKAQLGDGSLAHRAEPTAVVGFD